ncbi:hypothetical protein [Adonisia turfae]|uniref:hypothetical protein n=1 Tax=Adonisia turfae TaxID=2950184 RepID=UPI0013D7DAA7|nr:hypothetical protein [Adonisia turfae]
METLAFLDEQADSVAGGSGGVMVECSRRCSVRSSCRAWASRRVRSRGRSAISWPTEMRSPTVTLRSSVMVTETLMVRQRGLRFVRLDGGLFWGRGGSGEAGLLGDG